MLVSRSRSKLKSKSRIRKGFSRELPLPTTDRPHGHVGPLDHLGKHRFSYLTAIAKVTFSDSESQNKSLPHEWMALKRFNPTAHHQDPGTHVPNQKRGSKKAPRCQNQVRALLLVFVRWFQDSINQASHSQASHNLFKAAAHIRSSILCSIIFKGNTRDVRAPHVLSMPNSD